MSTSQVPRSQHGPPPPPELAAVRTEAPPADVHAPESSQWPLALAAGVTLLLYGVLTGLVFSALGALLTVLALGGWIRELHHE